MYFLAMDQDMTHTKDKTLALSRLALRAMVRLTCSRSGAFAKDWFDRAGLQVQWKHKHVLRVSESAYDTYRNVLDEEEKSSVIVSVLLACFVDFHEDRRVACHVLR